VSLLACPWQPIRQNNEGSIGYAPSSIVKKMNLGKLPFTAHDLLSCVAFSP
jgi:hypothetical protein